MVPEGEQPDFIRLLREQARQNAEVLVPRPGYPILGLAEPALTPAAVSGFQIADMNWTLVTLRYGSPAGTNGPLVAVTSQVTDPGVVAVPSAVYGAGPEEELRYAAEQELGPTSRAAPALPGPALVARETLPAGDALVCRLGDAWAARLTEHEERVVVTLVGRDVAPESVRLTRVADLRPMLEAHAAELERRLSSRRGQPHPPLADLPPAEGVDAFRALADFVMARQAEIRATAQARPGAGPRGRPPAAWDGGTYNALWQRAVRERQRLAGVDANAADAMVTSVTNHLGQLAEHARWFADDELLREAAIDETLRHAVLGDAVASEPAQRAWAAHWDAHLAGIWQQVPGSDFRVELRARDATVDEWLAAWASWASSTLT
jgi:hypothetical protein